MPIYSCQKDGKKGWKWGRYGFCYTSPDGRQKAIQQGVAAKLAGYEEDE